jgi:hypothetical protein
MLSSTARTAGVSSTANAHGLLLASVLDEAGRLDAVAMNYDIEDRELQPRHPLDAVDDRSTQLLAAPIISIEPVSAAGTTREWRSVVCREQPLRIAACTSIARLRRKSDAESISVESDARNSDNQPKGNPLGAGS